MVESPNAWIVAIEDEVLGSRFRPPCSMFRVPRAMRQVNDKHYDPRLIYFGLYTYERRRFPGGRWNTMEKFKREVASTLVGILKTEGRARFSDWEGVDEKLLAGFIWSDLCARVIPPESPLVVEITGQNYFDSTPIWEEKRLEGVEDKLQALCQMYDDAPEVPPVDARWMLILDAVFLASVLIFLNDDEPTQSSTSMTMNQRNHAPVNPLVQLFSRPGMDCNRNEIVADMWLFENQIPLSLIRDVLDAMFSAYGNNVDKTTVDELLRKLVVNAMERVLHILPGDCANNPELQKRMAHLPFSQCRHLLECLYTVLNPGASGNRKVTVEKEIILPVHDTTQSPELPVASKEEMEPALNAVDIAQVDPTSKDGTPTDSLGSTDDDDGSMESSPNTEIDGGRRIMWKSYEPHVCLIYEPSKRSHPQVRAVRDGNTTATTVREALGLDDTFPRIFHSMVLPVDRGMEAASSRREYFSLPTVSNLKKAGIAVKGDRTPGCRVDFQDSPWALGEATLYVSQLHIDDDTEKFLRNLLAYEIVSTQDNELATYLSCLDDLIDDEEDVRLLKEGECPVLTGTHLGDDKDVAAMFNNLLHNCRLRDKKELHEIRQRVNAHYEEKWRRMRVEFWETHCSKPWIVISILAASFLLLLTTLQTVYSVLGYY